jgi:hypothetical protein
MGQQRSKPMKKARSKAEPDGHLISAESQPNEFLIAAYVLCADEMMEIFRQWFIEAGHTGVIPEQDKIESLVHQRYKHPVLDGTSIHELAERNAAAGMQAVIEVFTEQCRASNVYHPGRTLGRERPPLPWKSCARTRRMPSRLTHAGPTLRAA